MLYNIKTGETYSIENVGNYSIVDNEGKEIENVPIQHNTRDLLNLVNKGLFSDYDYMPVTSKDIAQGVAAGIEANSGSYAIAKLVGTVVSSFTPLGSGLGFMLSNLGVETYEVARQWCMKDDPKKFWNEFVTNVQEIAQDNDSPFMRFLDGAGIGSSYFARGAHESLYKDWKDVLNENGWYTFGEIAGNLVRTTATIAAWGGNNPNLNAVEAWDKVSNGIITDYTLVDGLSEMGSKVGNGVEVWEAAKIAGFNSLASGAAGVFTLKAIPAFVRKTAPKLIDAYQNSGMINALTNGAENAAWYKIRNDIASIATGEEYETDPYTTAVYFGAGFGLSYLAHKFRGRQFQEEVDQTYKALPYSEPKLLEYSDAESRNVLRSLPKNMVFDNTGKVLRKEDSVEFAKALAARDRMMMNNHPTFRDFEDALQKEYWSHKSAHFYRDSILDIGANYKERMPVNPEGWKMRQLMQKASIPNTEDFNMSKAAIDVINDNYQLMDYIGLDKQQISELSAKAFKLASDKNKRIGNFEIRKAFNEVLGGSL